MNNKSLASVLVAILAMAASGDCLAQQLAPPQHPFLIQNSNYPIIHYNAGQTDVQAFRYGNGDRQIRADEVTFRPGGMGNPGLAHRRYDDGREAIVVSGPGRVAKYRFDGGRLEFINEVKIPGHEKTYMSPGELQKLVSQLDAAGTDDKAFLAITQAVAAKTGISKENWPNGMYTMMDRDGSYYAGYATTLHKFADATPGDATSPIRLVKSKNIKDELPNEMAAKVSRFLGVNMTYDGHVVVALAGVIAVLDRDLEKIWLAPIPGEAVDNGVVVDDGGIYTVTDKFMRKLVFTGDKLSIDEADGAWKEPYDWVKKKMSLSRGSGTTPTIMGFGQGNDQLVLTVDQGDPVKVVAFWRDEIPDDAKQVPGAASRRTAGSIPISFPVRTTIEWSPHVYGYGTMVFSSEFSRLIPLKGGLKEGGLDLLSTIMTMGTTIPGPRGAERFEWDQEKNEFRSVWTYMGEGFSWQLAPISTADNAVCLNTTKEGVYSLTKLDWDTGEVVGTIRLGESVKFNTGGTFVSPLPDGGLFLNGFFGPVRIAPPKSNSSEQSQSKAGADAKPSSANASHQPQWFPPLDPTDIYRQIDHDHLVRAYNDLHPEAAFMALYNSYFAEGSTAQNIGIMETSCDSRQIVLTANSETIYAVHPVNLKDQGGAVVLEVPTGVLGMANAPGWVLITDIGRLGPDQGKGGKYLFTAPDYQGEIPEGYLHFRSPANTIVWLLRGFVKNGDTKATVRHLQNGIRTYALHDAAKPPATTFYNTSESRTLGHPMDMLYEKEDVFGLIKQFFELNGLTFEKHNDIRSHLYDMGFFSDKVDPSLLAEAARIGDLRQRTLTFNNRASDALKWPGKSNWQWANNYVDENFTGRTSGFYSASQHQVWAHQATFNAIGMTHPPKGTGSQYITATKSSNGAWLSGENAYTLTIPANPPAKNFWSIILYDAHNRSMIQNEQKRWGVNSYAEGLKTEPDGSIVLHFAPTRPANTNDRNWIETNPQQGYFVWFRTYGPTDTWYNGSWVLPDIERK